MTKDGKFVSDSDRRQELFAALAQSVIVGMLRDPALARDPSRLHAEYLNAMEPVVALFARVESMATRVKFVASREPRA
jgi:hypothetical protein